MNNTLVIHCSLKRAAKARWSCAAALAAALLFAGVSPANANQDIGAGHRLQMLFGPVFVGSDGIGPGEAATKVRAISNGKILGVKRVGRGNRESYRVKVLTPKGRVKVYKVNAKSGQVVQ